jgi:NAD(P)-dependent dehydrogenase (short-subunit alcohol dehydrogenase family)
MSATHLRIALVTGGGSGIGAEVAQVLANDGWKVVITGRRQEALESVILKSKKSSGELIAITADVTDEKSVKNLFLDIKDKYGRLDLLFNNAGTGAPAVEIDQLSLDDWNKVVAVNLTGVFLCTKEAFGMMRNQDPQGGRIINNGSISAYMPRPLSIAYTATKHAISGLTKTTQLDGRKFNIACSQIDVGNAATEIGSAAGQGALQADGSVRPEPLIDPAEVARAVLYMASLPLEANVANMTIMATKMPFVGRG